VNFLRKLLLFDLDNTLLPFNSYWEKANVEAFNSSTLTKKLNYESFINLYRKYDKELWELHTKQLISLDQLRQQRFIKTMNDFGIKVSVDASQRYFDEFFNVLINSIVPDSKVNSMLLFLKEHYELGILTNGKITEQNQKIKKMGLNDVIRSEHIFISEEIGYEKPDPQSFYYTLNKLNISSSDSIYVGDSWVNDIIGSTNAGLSAVWVNEDHVFPENFSNSSKVIKVASILDLKESLKVIDNVLDI